MTDGIKKWQISNVWERHQKSNISCMKKLGAVCIQAIPDIISSRITCLQSFHIKDAYRHIHREPKLCPLFYKIMKLDLLYKGITQAESFRKKKGVKQDI